MSGLEKAREAVQRGAKLLDEEYGLHWPTVIEANRLDMSNCTRCLIGSLYRIYEEPFGMSSRKAFYRHVSEMTGVPFDERFVCTWEMAEEQALQYGFWKSDDYGYYELKTAWKEVIDERMSGEETLESETEEVTA